MGLRQSAVPFAAIGAGTTVTTKLPPVTKVSRSIQELTPADTMDVLVPSEVTSPVFQPLVPIPAAAVSSAALGSGGLVLAAIPAAAALLGIHTGGSTYAAADCPRCRSRDALLYLAAGLPPVGLLVRRRKGNRHIRLSIVLSQRGTIPAVR